MQKSCSEGLLPTGSKEVKVDFGAFSRKIFAQEDQAGYSPPKQQGQHEAQRAQKHHPVVRDTGARFSGSQTANLTSPTAVIRRIPVPKQSSQKNARWQV